jgi:hypothetical protein
MVAARTVPLTMILVGLGVACSSSATTAVAAPTGDAGTEDAPPGEVDAAIDAPGDSAPTPKACRVEADPNASDFARVEKCVSCCASSHPDQAFADALLVCACDLDPAAGPAACFTNCKTTACAAPAKPPSASCTQCLQNAILPAGDCIPSLTKACQGKAGCTGRLECLAGCTL